MSPTPPSCSTRLGLALVAALAVLTACADRGDTGQQQPQPNTTVQLDGSTTRPTREPTTESDWRYHRGENERDENEYAHGDHCGESEHAHGHHRGENERDENENEPNENEEGGDD